MRQEKISQEFLPLWKEEKKNNMRKTFQGTVIRAKTAKTAIVEVIKRIPHKRYKKLLKRNKRYKVDMGELVVGAKDSVEIEETRPLSKGKHFRIKKILKKSEEAQ